MLTFVHDYFCLGKKFLVYNLVSRNIKTKYNRSVFGVGWTVLSPLATACIYYFVFKIIMRVQVPNYLAFILSGVMPWAFFSQTVIEGMDSIVGHESLITKIPLPLQTLPFVNSITNLITLSATIPILFGVSILYHVSPGWHTALLFFYFSCLFFMAYALAVVFSVAYVFLRDMRHLMGIFLQLWMFATPVIYSDTMIPEKYKFMIALNPVGYIFVGLHQIFALGTTPSLNGILISIFWTLFLTVAGILIMKKYFKNIIEQL